MSTKNNILCLFSKKTIICIGVCTILLAQQIHAGFWGDLGTKIKGVFGTKKEKDPTAEEEVDEMMKKQKKDMKKQMKDMKKGMKKDMKDMDKKAKKLFSTN
ncbi:hypothetical protein NECID01_1063 [Nematocida sp. AWRm77]|nr:hypothetical protein NECID01_1063 [Nematocida sp. AWRm77]